MLSQARDLAERIRTATPASLPEPIAICRELIPPRDALISFLVLSRLALIINPATALQLCIDYPAPLRLPTVDVST